MQSHKIRVANSECKIGSEVQSMIKPKRLKCGDKIAIVSLSWGGLGDPPLIHKYHLARERLEKDFGLEVVCMPHALKGSEFVAQHPELRARDLMDAFRDPSISAIFCAIGGEDTIRTLPYINLDTIRENPKIFMGYSDSTINHLMMYKAGLVSFYGPSIMNEFGEYGGMFAYTKQAVRDMLFGDWEEYNLLPSPEWTDEHIPWQESNQRRSYTMRKEQHGYECINGEGLATGHLLGGCLDVFLMANGTSIWPSPGEWDGAILFWETSEDKPSPDFVRWTLRNLAAQGILRRIRGMLVGKPQDEAYYEEYKAVIRQVVAEEEHLEKLPILYNINIGHARPIGILPYGVQAEIHCEKRTVRILEAPTEGACHRPSITPHTGEE